MTSGATTVVDVTQDGGSTFTSVTGLPGVWGGATMISDGASGPRFVASTAVDGAHPYVSDVVFSGSSYSITSNLTTQRISLNAWSPDGHLWGGTVNPTGPVCSSDLGATWAAHC